MALTFKFYKDAALTQEITALNPLSALQKDDDSIGPVEQEVFLGSVIANKRLRADSNPGTDQIVITVADADTLTGEPATAVKLATTQVGLASAVAGDSLDAGVQILSGEVNSFSFWVQLDDQTGVVGTYTDLKLLTNLLIEDVNP